jgi:hypothetical protein
VKKEDMLSKASKLFHPDMLVRSRLHNLSGGRREDLEIEILTKICGKTFRSGPNLFSPELARRIVNPRHHIELRVKHMLPD